MCVLSTLCGNVDKHSPFDIYIYIYIYMCVCVCVCVDYMTITTINDARENHAPIFNSVYWK